MAVIGAVAGALLAVIVMQAGIMASATSSAADRVGAAPRDSEEEGNDIEQTPEAAVNERAAYEAALPRRPCSPPLVNLYTRPIIDYRYPNKIEQGGFRRVGTLSGQVDGQTQVLPLFSRPTIYPGRYHYHSTTKGFDGEPVGVHYQGRDCLSDMGCAEIYGNDDEPIEMPNLSAAPFKATIFT